MENYTAKKNAFCKGNYTHQVKGCCNFIGYGTHNFYGAYYSFIY